MKKKNAMYSYVITKIKVHSIYFLGGSMNYNCKRWKKLRERILKRDGYLCQYYKRYGKRMEATVVHHIFPAEEYPQYQWCEWNLISLSNEAHEKMHDRNTREITPCGIVFQNKIKLEKSLTPP